METNKPSNRIHPLVATAAVAVTLVSLVGVAAMTGILPNSYSSNPQGAALTAPANSVVASDTKSSVAADATLASSAVVDASSRKAEAPATNNRVASNYAPSAAPQPQRSHPRTTYVEPKTVAQAPSVCTSCGRVESVHSIQQPAQPSGLGIAAGAVLGGVLGNQIGDGNGRTLATVAGAVGGGYAGNEVEKRTRATTSYQVRVRMDDGSIRTFPYAAQPGWSAGERVRVVNGSLTARG
jgi:outer membrane lipoprotein SlyB